MIIYELSKFLTNLKYENIPQESIEKTKLCFLDYLAVYLRGLETDNSKIAIKTINELYNFSNNFSNNVSNYISNDVSNGILSNGLIYGIASHSLDLDDGHRYAQLHPGSVVFSTILALLSDNTLNLEITAKEFFETVIASYEIAIVLGKLVNPSHRNQGFHSTGTIGSFAAGAAASKLLKLNLNQTINCLGLCATQSAGLLEADHAGTMGKSLHVGKAVYNGIFSAFLAKNGFTGGESLIDGKEGFLKAMALDLNEFNKNSEESFLNISNFLEENLGQFHINEVYLKKYPFCRHIHSTIDSTLVLKESIKNLNKNSDLFEIDSIIVETYQIACEHNNYNPKNIQDLKQSLPYALAITLVCKDLSLNTINDLIDVGLFDFKENSGNDVVEENFDQNFNQNFKQINLEIKQIHSIVKKIKIELNESFDSLSPEKRPSKVIIKLNKPFNKTIEDTTYYPLGESENPLNFKDILEKFKLLNPNYDFEKLDMVQKMENYSLNYILDDLGVFI